MMNPPNKQQTPANPPSAATGADVKKTGIEAAPANTASPDQKKEDEKALAARQAAEKTGAARA